MTKPFRFAPGDPLIFLQGTGKPLKPVLAPLFYEGQVTVWAGDSNLGKTSEAIRTGFQLPFNPPSRFYRKADPASVLIISPEGGGTVGMALRAQMVAHNIDPATLQSRFSIIDATAGNSTRSTLNPLNEGFAEAVANHIKEENKRLSAPINLIIFDGFLFMLGADVSNDEVMAPAILAVKDLATNTGTAVLLLVNTLKGRNGDYRGGESLRSLADNVFFLRKAGNRRQLYWRDEPQKFKRRIPKTFGYEFELAEMPNPENPNDIWEYSRLIRPLRAEDVAKRESQPKDKHDRSDKLKPANLRAGSGPAKIDAKARKENVFRLEKDDLLSFGDIEPHSNPSKQKSDIINSLKNAGWIDKGTHIIRPKS